MNCFAIPYDRQNLASTTPRKPNWARIFNPSYPASAGVEVKTSSGFPVLDAAALRPVSQWEFEPARIGLQTFESEIEVPVRFKLAP
jgi:TonB family protein